jgi:Fic family protein
MKKPSIPLSLTHRMAGQVCEIAELVGSLQLQTAGRQIVSPDSDDHIHGIQSLLALEHTSLESELIRSMCQGGSLPELERVSLLVCNLERLFRQLLTIDAISVEALLSAHAHLLAGISQEPGAFRRSNSVLHHGSLQNPVPSYHDVSTPMYRLFAWFQESNIHPLLASCVAHFEIRRLSPFLEGNEILALLWQKKMLGMWYPNLAYLPLESMLCADIAGYERELNKAILRKDDASFVEFLLGVIFEALTTWGTQLQQGSPSDLQVETQVKVQAETSAKTPVKRRTNTQKKVLQLLTAAPNLTLKEVAEQLGVANSTVERAVFDLKKANKLSFNGPRKNGCWEVLPD